MPLTADKFLVPDGVPSGGFQKTKSVTWGEFAGKLKNANITMPSAAGNLNDVIAEDGVGGLTLKSLNKLNAATEISVNHTVLDSDKNIDVTTGATDKTISLPPLASSLGREITLSKADSGVGSVIADGDGAEPINDSPTNSISEQYESKTYIAFATEWRIR